MHNGKAVRMDLPVQRFDKFWICRSFLLRTDEVIE